MKYITCFFIVILLTSSMAFAAPYEVKGQGVTSVVYGEGKATTSKSADEVVYIVDLENKKITRTGVFNAGIKEEPLAGLQQDNTEYKIVHSCPNYQKLNCNCCDVPGGALPRS